MTEQQLHDLVGRVAAGEGVESALLAMALQSDVEMEFLKNHPNARTWLKEAKQKAEA